MQNYYKKKRTHTHTNNTNIIGAPSDVPNQAEKHQSKWHGRSDARTVARTAWRTRRGGGLDDRWRTGSRAEGRLSFHPVKNTMSYFDQVQEAAPYIRAFVTERGPRYLAHFEALLDYASASSSGGEAAQERYFVGGAVSVVDLQVWVMLDVTEQQVRHPTHSRRLLATIDLNRI